MVYGTSRLWNVSVFIYYMWPEFTGPQVFGHAIVKMFHMSWYPSLNITWLVKYIAGDIKFMVNGKIKIRHRTGELVYYRCM